MHVYVGVLTASDGAYVNSYITSHFVVVLERCSKLNVMPV